ncbi:glycogen synthase [Flavimarina sp. Hel_I_48]|uniref:glycogen synthase n=1 Tax=Flavimarina sp. Hel_I_48 TaxID=1392488 RepID=UPI0004DED945|nr:glycogen/starch synthase [Flavimarina sp. Hel_I_48]
MQNFLFVAAENDALADCKAGGMADVVRDVPRQIAANGDQVHVVVPSYGRLHQKGKFLTTLNFHLKNEIYSAELYEVSPKKEFKNITHYVIHHPEITAGSIAHIYHHDAVEPYYNDSIKFFIFCTAVAQAIAQGAFGKLNVAHLHDWHTTTLLFLRDYNPGFAGLKNIKFVYSIHNLSIQGIRPFNDNYASLVNFFPSLHFDYDKLRDPRFHDCINLMAIGIRLADAVHTVSPSYKEDILQPSDPPEFIGGEHLEGDLQQAEKEGRLFGILNGVNYKNFREAERNRLFPNVVRAIFKWLQQESKKYKSDFLAHTGEKIVPFLDKAPGFTCASVARLTDQKFYFFKRSPEFLVEILTRLKKVNGVFILLGTGVPEYEEMMRELSYKYENFIFINGQSEDVIDSIYMETDLYFMPSQFEPCGISQMLAMRNGTPCFVHNTGGLKDTVEHGKTGFVFDGESYGSKIMNMLTVLEEILDLYKNDPKEWSKIEKNASKARFSWEKSIKKYYTYLYS